MLNVPSEIQAVIKNDATLKNFRVHFPNGERADITNENIVYESVSFTESVCSNDVFRFGLAEASVIEFETVGVENIIDKTIECSMEFKVPANLQGTYGEWYSIPYGTFIVDKCPRNHNDVTHRRVIGYSLLKNNLSSPTFMQNRLSIKPEIFVPISSMSAYLTNNISEFEEYSPGEYTGGAYFVGTGLLYDKNKYAYLLDFYDETGTVEKGAEIRTAFYADISEIKGYKLEFEEAGETSYENMGMEVVKLLNNLELDLTYNESGKKNYSNNEDVLRKTNPMLFAPVDRREDITTDTTNYIFYQPFNFETNKFIPVYYEDSKRYTIQFGWFKGLNDGSPFKVCLYKQRALNDNVYDRIGEILIEGFKANGTLKCYRSTGQNEFGNLRIKSTLLIDNAYAYKKPSIPKTFYSKMYAFSNAFSNRDLLNGMAELNGAFVHSERDGSLSMESLNNETPYQLTLSDIENSVWWDEYDVNPIGTIRYTFTNPDTGQIANGEYVIDQNSKSVYDLTGNKMLESINFTVLKATSYSKMTNKNIFYKYAGDESGFKKDYFYYHNGSRWVEGGYYESITSIVNFVLDKFFVPHINAVNFTPVEMDIRGLPFLEAGDAFTLTLNDGTVLNSYILNHIFDGVQRITENVTSVSGEVVS